MWLLRARLTSWLRWRNAASTARLLLKLARAEHSSYLDLMEAANTVADPLRRAAYLKHATDERRHATIFRARALELDPSAASQPNAFLVDHEHLFSTLGEARFLGVVFLGEQRGRAQLDLYRRELEARGDRKTPALLETIVRDEAEHEAYTASWATPADKRWAAWWELWRGWRRLGAPLARAMFSASVWLLFGALSPFRWVWRRRGHGWQREPGKELP